MAAAILATLLATTSGLMAFCDSNLETYALFQCSERAYFAPIPGTFTKADISAVFWQVGFGNRTVNSGQGLDGTGVQSKSNFNGNDSGLFSVDLLDAAVIFPTIGFPAGSICLGSNNWANSGVDGCCDNPRTIGKFSYTNAYHLLGPYDYTANDDILNPYFGTYFDSTGYRGYYSLASIQDYPTAVLLTTPVDPASGAPYFAIAAVTNMDRLNTGGNGVCNTSVPGTNLAACDIRQGEYNFGEVTNGGANVITAGRNNVVTWQQPPEPFVNITAGDPNDPNAVLTVDVTWTPPTIQSDGRIVASNNPTMATKNPAQPRDPNASPGVGVPAIDATFGMARYEVRVAAENDPNFTTLKASYLCSTNASLSSPECTSPTSATFDISSSDCMRIRTRFGPPPRETVTTTAPNCALGRCGDVGYEVVGKRFCPGTSTCVPSAEICNGLDDDCDGDVDDGFNLGTTCDGVGQCGTGVFECDPNTPMMARCSTDIGGSQDQSVPEICDGLDNSCDGMTDETFGTLGQMCNGTAGACVDPNGPNGVVECNGADPNLTQCSYDPGGSEDRSGTELCDMIDNDCDASTDEIFMVGQACNGEGECGAGTFECDAGSIGQVCSTDPGGSADQSAPESCDGLDNDCDASTDEDFSVGQSCDGVGACGAGTFECSDPNNSICSTDIGGSQDQSAAELCDSIDNSCDGQTDEGFMLGQSCTGTGECGAGVLECGDPNSSICSTDPGGSQDESGVEICGNGLDEDCDGQADEIGGMEVCDGSDNNCDGMTDEGFNVGQACTGIGQCGAGLLECSPSDPAATICSSSPGGTDDQSTMEVCDFIDNDCDATTDEGFQIGQVCTAGGVCGNGVWECNATSGVRRCSTGPGGTNDKSSTEICDGLNNDCDSMTDEDFLVGQSCRGTGQCSGKPLTNDPGTFECNGPNANRCSLDPGGSEDQSSKDPNGMTIETCEPDIDDDCDGMTDEDGVCASSFMILSHANGDPVDCTDPRLKQPHFAWFAGPYDRFVVRLSWDPLFPKNKTIKPYVQLRDPFWEPNGKKWKKACRKAIQENPGMPVFYLEVTAKDLEEPKASPVREVTAPVVQVNITPPI
jgi:hypothetical protein